MSVKKCLIKLQRTYKYLQFHLFLLYKKHLIFILQKYKYFIIMCVFLTKKPIGCYRIQRVEVFCLWFTFQDLPHRLLHRLGALPLGYGRGTFCGVLPSGHTNF